MYFILKIEFFTFSHEFSNHFMEDFEPIRFVSYKKYASFTQNLSKFNNYTVNIPDNGLDMGVFTLGGCKFSILPVLRTTQKESKTKVELFNQIADLKMPLTTEIEEGSIGGISESFRLSYKISAIVCEKVGGITFLSATPKPNFWIWFVILTSINAPGKKCLSDVNDLKKSISDEEATQWYSLMNI